MKERVQRQTILFLILLLTTLNSCSFQTMNKLMIIGGNEKWNERDIEIVNLSGKDDDNYDSCDLKYLEHILFAAGNLINDQPTVCGGLIPLGSDSSGHDFYQEGPCARLTEKGEWVKFEGLLDNWDEFHTGMAQALVPNQGWWITGGIHFAQESKIMRLDNLEWEDGPVLPYHSYNHCSVQIDDTTTLAAGGLKTDYNANTTHFYFNATYLFNWETMSWNRAQDFPIAREDAMCDLDPISGDVIMAGGRTWNQEDTDSLVIFNLETRSWSEGINIQQGNAGYMVSNSTTLLLTGGYNDPHEISVYRGHEQGFVPLGIKMKTFREKHVAMFVPDSVLEKNC